MADVHLSLLHRECYRGVWIDTVCVSFSDGRRYTRTVYYDGSAEARCASERTAKAEIDAALLVAGKDRVEDTIHLDYPRTIPCPVKRAIENRGDGK